MNTLGIDPQTRLQRVRASLKRHIRDGTCANVLWALSKHDARFVLGLVDDALAKADINQAETSNGDALS